MSGMWLLKVVGWVFVVWFVGAQIYSELAHWTAVRQTREQMRYTPEALRVLSQERLRTYILRRAVLRLFTVGFTIFLVWLLLR